MNEASLKLDHEICTWNKTDIAKAKMFGKTSAVTWRWSIERKKIISPTMRFSLCKGDRVISARKTGLFASEPAGGEVNAQVNAPVAGPLDGQLS